MINIRKSAKDFVNLIDKTEKLGAHERVHYRAGMLRSLD